MANTRTGTAPSGLQLTGDILGIGLQAFGDILTAKEQSRGLHFNADELLRESRLMVERMRDEGVRVASAQRAGFAKGGVELRGTPLEVMAATADQVDRNILEEQQSAARQAAELRRAARRKKKSGKLAAIGSIAGSFFGPAGTAIGGAIGGLADASQSEG